MVRRSRRERLRLIGAYRCSEFSQRAFAERHGINLRTFVGWLRKERQNGNDNGSGTGRSSGAKFAEVTVAVDSPVGSLIEVLLPDGVRIRLTGAAAVQQTSALIQALSKQ